MNFPMRDLGKCIHTAEAHTEKESLSYACATIVFGEHITCVVLLDGKYGGILSQDESYLKFHP